MEQSLSAQRVLSVLETTCGPNRLMPTEQDLPLPATEGARVINHMESFWIKTLHNAFRQQYTPSQHPDVVVLSKAYPACGWKRNEFLHDITVLERIYIRSAYKEKNLPVARRILWQVESELSGNGRDIAIDFSKLIAGSAENKLLIVRRPMERQADGQDQVCRFVSEMAVACLGNLFLAFVPTYASSHQHLETYWKPNQPLPFDLFERPAIGPLQLISKPKVSANSGVAAG